MKNYDATRQELRKRGWIRRDRATGISTKGTGHRNQTHLERWHKVGETSWRYDCVSYERAMRLEGLRIKDYTPCLNET